MRFTYQTGAQPLAGYTIQRGIHRGGFGEVYFANSIGGKEVALKLLHREEQDVEIRGVSQCLNLKHPNLVNLFDLKTDGNGDHWVVMEYVSGSSLEDVLAAFPKGLPLNEVQDWLSGLVAGVAHLHERGIVHRDLKPANVYRENGVVKVGDVGLSKRLDSDRRRQHTQSVGTVYYMAPEVANGQYGPEVDVYSLGVMLYEMITGKLPFDGETMAEVLMKHLTAQPDLSLIPSALRPMLARALEKDPRKRTPNVKQLEREFLRAVGHFDSREPRPTVAERFQASKSVPLPQVARAKPVRRLVSADQIPAIRPWNVVLPELASSIGFAAIMASLLSAALYLSLVELSQAALMPGPEHAVFFGAASVVGAWFLLIGHACSINFNCRRRHHLFARVVVGAMIGLSVFELAQFLLVETPRAAYATSSAFSTLKHHPLIEADGNPTRLGYVCFFVVWLGLRSWSRDMNPYRRKRLSAALTASAGVMAYLTSLIFTFPQWYAVLWAITISVTVQLASKWTPTRLSVHER